MHRTQCEIKHRILTRHYRRGNVDKDLKPNADIRDILNVWFSRACAGGMGERRDN